MERATNRGSARVYPPERREDVDAAGTSFTHILHPLEFRLSVGDYMEYYFAGEVGGTLCTDD